MPDWIKQAFLILSAIAGTLGLRELFPRLWKNWFPTKAEKEDLIKKNAEWTNLYTNAAYVKTQLSQELKKMVDEETEKLRDIIVQREIEHRQTIEDYIKRISDKDRQLIKFQTHLSNAEKEIVQIKEKAEKEISALKGRVRELENSVNNKNGH